MGTLGFVETGFILVIATAYLYSLVWVYREADVRDVNPILMTLGVAVVAWPLGLIVWLLVRPDGEGRVDRSTL